MYTPHSTHTPHRPLSADEYDVVVSISTEVCDLGCHNWREGQINLGRRVSIVAGHQSSAAPTHQEDVSLDSKVKEEGRGSQ